MDNIITKIVRNITKCTISFFFTALSNSSNQEVNWYGELMKTNKRCLTETKFSTFSFSLYWK
uniref:Uncharacterized protein n=1 Tax=Octopus bimaculoides TaxID=37653 RepID=A0A0L8I8R6_OCTBM